MLCHLHRRGRLAAAGTLVVATAGTMAALGAPLTGAAAAPAHLLSARPAPAARAVAPTVTIEVGKDALTTSHRVTPGNTVFQVRRHGGGGGVDLVRLRAGYTLQDVASDFQKLYSGDLKAINRIDHKVVFFGGVPTPSADGDAAAFGTYVPAGDYYLVNFDKGTASPLRVRGQVQARALPSAQDSLDYVGDMRFDTVRTLHNGWITQTNTTDEPHFTVLNKVKPGTTRQEVKKYFDSGNQAKPPFALKESQENLPLSPGHTVHWLVRESTGSYAALCFWPSDENGMPHATMGMYELLQLRD